MQRHRIALAALLFASGLPLSAQQWTSANEELLRSARLWEARDRGDLAVVALEKLANARPDDADVLRRLGELQLRIGDAEGANRTLQRMQRLHPEAAATASLLEAYRFSTRDRLRLASVRRLLELDRGDEALQSLRELFPQGAPDGDLGLEYNRLLSRTPGGWSAGRAGYERLIANHPDEPRYQMALAQLLLEQPATRQEGLRQLAALSAREDLRGEDIGLALKSAVERVGLGAAPQPALEALLLREPNDEALQSELAQRRRGAEQRRLRESRVLASIDPGFQAEQRAALDRQLDQLVQQPSPPPAARQALAVLRLSESRASEAWALLRETPARPARIERAALFARWSAESRQAFARGELRLAERLQRAALALQRSDIEAAVALADETAAAGQAALAGELLQDLARLAPADADLLRSRSRWLADNGRADEALALIDADRGGSAGAALRQRLRAEVLARRAETVLQAGRRGEALRDLEQAQTLRPEDPWIRYSLARLYAQLGLTRQGRELMAEGVARDPGSADPRYAQALYLSSIEAREEALAALGAVPVEQRSAGMRSLEARLRIGLAVAAAQRAAAAGDLPGATQALADVEPLAGDDPALLRQLALAWLALGERERALAPLRLRAEPQEAASTPMLLAWAEVQDQARDEAGLARTLQTLRERELDTAQRDEVAGLQRSQDLREIRLLQSAGRYAEARGRLAEALAREPDDRRLRLAQAELDGAAGDWAQARQRYAALLQAWPDDADLRLSHARALAESGERGLALAELERVLAAAPPDDLSTRLGVVRRRVAMDDLVTAEREMQGLQARYPEDGEVLLQLARLREAQGRYAEAAETYRRAGRLPDLQTADSAARGLAAVEARRQGWITGSIEHQDKPGDAGVSGYSSFEAPLELRVPYRYDGHFIAHADTVHVDAGRLRPDYDTAALFGQIQAAGPGSLATLGGGRDSAQTGVALAVGYETPRWNADLGTTPLGFEQEDLVGGVEWTPKLGRLDAALGLSRRPVTSSLLSYAGARDPVSGERWGGVRETGISARLAYYGPRYSLSGTLEASQLRGRNVLDNDYFGGRVAGDWKWLDRPGLRAYAGAAATYWDYAENLRFYTFGHGGYYSPQSYLNLSLPLELQGRHSRWTWELRAAASVSVSEEKSMPFYPTDAALQAQAAGSPLPSGFSAPVYRGGSGSGFGYSLRGVAEYQLAHGLVIGARAGVDRSDFYEPNFFTLYFRHLFGGRETTPYWPPRPPRPYSQF